jgi:hypothetical protein
MLTTIEEFILLDVAIQMAKTSADRKAAKAEMLSTACTFGGNFDDMYDAFGKAGTAIQKEVFHKYTVPWAGELSRAITCSLKGKHRDAKKLFVDLYITVRFAE